MSEMKTFVEIVKEKGVHWDEFTKEHKFAAMYIIEAAEEYKNQFPPITDEEICSVGAARSQSMPSLMAASGFLNGFKEGAKWMRDKIFK